MSALIDLQRGVQAYLLGESDAVAARIVGSDAGSAEERMRIYADGMRLRYLEVLGEEFLGLHALLGDAGFARLARAYGVAHPSRRPSIRWFGRSMPEFLASTPPWSAQPVLAEMAAFEWARSLLVDAADSPVASMADVAAVAPQRWAAMRPRPVTALRRVDLHCNVAALCRAFDAGDVPPDVESAVDSRSWLLWRKGVAIHWRSIDADEAWALDAIASGETFGSLCEGLCDWHGPQGAPMRAASLLKQWLGDELLASL